MTHNQILWVWMRVGSAGFVAFWMMVSAIVIYCCQAVCRPQADAEIKAVCICALLTTAMLMIFGLLDLQLSNFRDMLFTGLWVGLAAAITGGTGAAAEDKAIKKAEKRL